MDLLKTCGNSIVDEQGNKIRLRGVNIGGWMNMEDFINCYPGSETGMRQVMASVLGAASAEFFFERMLDHMFQEEDIAFVKELGFNALRIPLNYRHFEKDDAPFSYLEKGFERLDWLLGLCEKYGIYGILDLHAVQGWQNTDWHSDNAGRHSLFWSFAQFQERFYALWQEIATRYRGRKVVAGYDLMNEPIANARYGRFAGSYTPDWDNFNRIYRTAVTKIREVDPDHIIFLEGDNFSTEFAGMDEPFADNLVYSSHVYTAPGLHGQYPGVIDGKEWNLSGQREDFYASEGAQFCMKHKVPLLISEFGSAHNGPIEEQAGRLLALADELEVFQEFGASWTVWSYKDSGVMSLLSLDPESEFMELTAEVRKKKELLNTQLGMGWLPPNQARQMEIALADYIEKVIDMPHVDTQANRWYLGQLVFSEFAAIQLQPAYAQPFRGMSHQRIDEILSAFALKNCVKNTEKIEVLKKYAKGGH